MKNSSILESARLQIAEKVREISLTTPGGEKFFDALDKEINGHLIWENYKSGDLVQKGKIVWNGKEVGEVIQPLK